MNFVNQVVTIVAVVVGAGMTYLVTALGDRAKDRREVARQWVDRKLEAYTRYANDIKGLAMVARQRAAEKMLHHAAPEPARGEDLTAALAEAELRRSASYEAVKLLGDASTLRATRELNEAVHRLEWIANGRLKASRAQWERSWHLYAEATDDFRRSVRGELGIPGSFLPRGEWAPPSLPDDDGTEPAAAGPRPALT
jgi:YD repeat-containing protein